MPPPQVQPVDKGRGKHLKLMTFGLPGVGKTVLAGTSAEVGKTLILRPPTDHTDSIPRGSGVYEWVLQDWNDMTDAAEYLRHDAKAEGWQWVWLDGISNMQDYGLDHIWADTIARTPHRKAFGLDRGEYGINMFRLGQWIRHMSAMDTFNFGVTALPFEGEDSDGNPFILPWVQGKGMSWKIAGYMNIVGYLRLRRNKTTGETYRELVTAEIPRGNEATIYGKEQFGGALGGKLREPTIAKIVNAVAAAQPRARGRGRTGRSPAARKRATREAKSLG